MYELKVMKCINLKTAFVVGIGAVLVGICVYQAQQVAKLRELNQLFQMQIAKLQSENEQLSKIQFKPSPLVAPKKIMAVSQPALPTQIIETNLIETNNLYARSKDKHPKLTHEQVEAYLKVNGRNAANLLAAFRTSGDKSLLKEAMQNYPNDPHVAFEAISDRDLSADEKRQWLNTFEKSAPNNALPNYLSALNYFDSGQIEQGIQEISAANGKQMDDYTGSRAQNNVEAFIASGYSLAEAEFYGLSGLTLPQTSQLSQLSRDMVDLANAYRHAGNPDSAQATLQLAANIGQGFVNPSAGQPEINQLVGIAMELRALGATDPYSFFGSSGQTVQDQLNLLNQQKTAIIDLGQQFESIATQMTEQDWINYYDRYQAFGGSAAVQWAVSKYGNQ